MRNPYPGPPDPPYDICAEETLFVAEPPTVIDRCRPVAGGAETVWLPSGPAGAARSWGTRGEAALARVKDWISAVPGRITRTHLHIVLAGMAALSVVGGGALSEDDEADSGRPVTSRGSWRRPLKPPHARDGARARGRRPAPRAAVPELPPPAPPASAGAAPPAGLSREVLLARGIEAMESGRLDEARYYFHGYQAHDPGRATELTLRILSEQLQKKEGGR